MFWIKLKHIWFEMKHIWFEMKRVWIKLKHIWFEMKHIWFKMRHIRLYMRQWFYRYFGFPILKNEVFNEMYLYLRREIWSPITLQLASFEPIRF